MSPPNQQSLHTLGITGIFEKPSTISELKITLTAIAERICSAN